MKDNRKNYNDLQNFINEVFNTKENTFDLIHPSLHQEKYNPTDCTSVIKNGDEYIACGSLVNYNKIILNNKISVCSIGNIATNPKYANQGYMKRIMNELIEESFQYDLACLVGDRLRYNRYNFDTIGIEHQYILSKKNTQSIFFNEYNVEIKQSQQSDNNELYNLYIKQNVKVDRNKESFFDKLKTWQSSVYNVLIKDEIIGYYVINNNEVLEIVIEDKYFTSLLYTIFNSDYITINVSDYQIYFRSTLNKVCIHYNKRSETRYLVNNFTNVIKAYLELKLSYTKIQDLNLGFKIKGINKIETFSINIKNNKLSILETKKIDYELSYFEALHLFFGLLDLNNQNDSKLSFLPLPLYINKLDVI